MAVRRLPNDNLGHEENELIFGGIIGKFDEFDGGFDVFGEPTFTFGMERLRHSARILSSARCAVTGLISNAIHGRPSRCAATQVVPPPAKKSTTSP